MGPGCLQAVKPHGRARPKTGTRSSGCCRGVLGALVQGGQYPGKTLDIEKLGIPDHRGGKVTKPNIEPAVADPRGQRLGRDPVGFVGSVDPFLPLGISIPGKLPFSRYKGEGYQAVGPRCLPAVKPHGRAGGGGGEGAGGQYPGKTLDIEKLGIPDHRGGKVTQGTFRRRNSALYI